MSQSSPADTGYTGALDYQSAGSEFNAHAFLIQQQIGRVSTSTLVRVQAVTNAGGVSPVGFVDVLPLVNQIDGAGNATAHATVFGLPYFRLQGGTNAIILDPQVGDIGIATFADHDISSVKASKGQANPGSRRRFDMADGLYIGGVINGTPAQYVQFSTDGITVVSPTKVTIQAPLIDLTAATKITLTSPEIELDGLMTQGTGATTYAATIQGPVTVITDVIASGTSLHTHEHPDPQGGTTGPPI